ncbi:MAG TPA: PIG-L family deacetylase [Candidatus Xenobia bacterium]|nr:PIG-L family deacetylase [Candidatus Xenobia bacterium]
MSKVRAGVIALALILAAAAAAATNPELEAQLARLPRLGTIVYITAHPDDESGPVITYYARGLHARVVILCLTRGEGGQNQAGPELGEELAEVRMRELRAAAAGYGAEVRFLGAPDFGYSKSLEESLRVWGEEKVLGELVRQIRELRPLVVMSAWTGTERDGGGSHHRAAGLLARKAFAAASDPKAFPEQIARGYQPWQPRYFLTRNWTGEGEGPKITVPVGEIDPATGKTYEELGWEAFRNHQSQGMGTITLGQVTRFRRYFLYPEEVKPDGVAKPKTAAELAPPLTDLPALFPEFEFLTKWRERLAQASELAESARKLLSEGKTSDAALSLLQGAALIAALRREIPEDNESQEANSLRTLLESEQNQFLEAAAALAGVEFTAYTDRAALTPGEQVWVGLSVRAGPLEVFRAAGFEFAGLRLEALPGWSIEPLAAETTPTEQRTEFMVATPEKFDPLSVPTSPLRGRATLKTGSLELVLRTTAKGLAAAPIEPRGLAEKLDIRRLFGRHQMGREHVHAEFKPVYLSPPLTLEMETPLRLLAPAPAESLQEWCVKLEAHRPGFSKVNVWLDVPNGWYTPLPQEVDLSLTNSARSCFAVIVPANLEPDTYVLAPGAAAGEQTYRFARRVENAGTTIERVVYEPARAELEVLDVKVPAGLRVAYIGFPNDPVPRELAPLGILMETMDEAKLAAATLADYDAIVISNRAYDYRPDLTAQAERLLEYVKGGGVLIVEHQGRGWEPAKFAPFPGVKSGNSPRVTDETAPVRVLAPQNPVLSFPNQIGEDDWSGWVQERGLYFWESWSENYTPLVEMADPGEPPQRGALLYARYGDGVYIYCGLALFRQVRAGIPGGIRLYVNLLSQRRAMQQTAVPNNKD